MILSFETETIPFVVTVSPSTRTTLSTPPFEEDARIPVVEYFPLINERDVEITFWETEFVIGDDVDPLRVGSKILGSQYTPDDGVPIFVGDGSPKTIYLNATIPKGKRFAVSFNNTNTTHERPMDLLIHKEVK